MLSDARLEKESVTTGVYGSNYPTYRYHWHKKYQTDDRSNNIKRSLQEGIKS